jgi:outer membrane biosynthesis protein TonB
MKPRTPGNVGLALAGTLVVHSAAAAWVYASGAAGRAPLPPSYKVRLVAAPAPDPAARRAPEAVDRPAETPAPAPARRTPRNTAARAEPPRADATPREAAPRTTPAAEPAPGERPSTGDDVATISTEGIDFPFPEYLQNIVSQVRRRWQRPEQSVPLEAEVAFLVQRDGAVTDLRFIKRSGNFAFDLEAQGAVEEAGRFRAFGTLPDGWASDLLYVRFYFSGRRQ